MHLLMWSQPGGGDGLAGTAHAQQVPKGRTTATTAGSPRSLMQELVPAGTPIAPACLLQAEGHNQSSGHSKGPGDGSQQKVSMSAYTFP